MSNAKKRRNKLCSCGSGKKFKDCCYSKSTNRLGDDSTRLFSGVPSEIGGQSLAGLRWLFIGLGIIGVLLGVVTSRIGGLSEGVFVGLASLFLVLMGAALVSWSGSRNNPSPVLEGTRVGNFVADVPETRRYAGQDYEVQYKSPIPGSKHNKGRPAALCLRVPFTTSTTLLFNTENWFDRFCKRVGIAREHCTGDIEFDDAVYVRTPSNEFAERYLADAAKRVAVRSLLGLGFTSVELDGTHAYATWVGFNPSTDGRENVTVDAMQNLLILISNLPEVNDVCVEQVNFGKSVQKGLLAFEALSITTLGFGCLYPALRTREPVVAGLLLCLVAFPVFGWLAAYLLRGRSNSHDQWEQVMRLSLIAIPLGCIGMIVGVNGLTDTAPLETRASTVVGKKTIRGSKGSVSYQITILDEGRSGKSLEFDVWDWEFNSIVQGKSKVELTVGHGRLEAI